MMNENDGWDQPYGYDEPTAPAAPAAAAPSGDPWTADELKQSQDWANQYYSSHQIPASFGTPDDIANSYVQKRRGGMNHADAMAYLQTVPGLLGWEKQAPPGGGGAPAPAPAGGGGGGTPPPSVVAPPTTGSIGAMDPAAVFNPPAAPSGMPSWLGPAPTAPALPNLPTFSKPAPFTEPDYQAALKDSGYQAEVSEGQRALEQSAAARGVLNGGGTLKDVSMWGQNMAAQKVNDVRDRAVNNYLLNYQTQHVDPYKYAYQSALDTFNGGLGIWNGNNSIYQTQAQVGQRAQEDQWQQAYTPFNDLWNRRISVGLS